MKKLRLRSKLSVGSRIGICREDRKDEKESES
jgi:hypothetical protein